MIAQASLDHETQKRNNLKPTADQAILNLFFDISVNNLRCRTLRENKDGF